jgi:GTP-binding protein EngB required for normal cell division
LQANTSGARGPEPGRIGAPLEELRQHLIRYGDVLTELVEPSARQLVENASLHLKQLTCRIAVVGQIKSGKSSFINAFVQQPDFLPTSVTPWTTAVTNLHFGQRPPGEHAAIFTFLHGNEWRELAESGGRIRELTKQLVPGFEPELLHRQADLLRARAQQRLGAEFESLLGQAHFYTHLAPGTLQTYICSGDYAGQTGPIPIGKYSDITRSADIYCGRGPFAFPSTVIDTPGTNDPFVIRDEITRRSLGSADVYIVVLTARQPLSDTDVALLRIMRGLNKDRIIVLINRVDDLSDVESELPQVVSFVRQRLEAEFPGAAIPLLFGSAWWASQAMVFDPEAISRILNRRSAAYLLKAGLLRPQDLDPALLGDPERRERLRRSLYAMSGMPAVYQAIDTLMRAAQPAHMMRHITYRFAEMARMCATVAHRDLQVLSSEGAGGARQMNGRASRAPDAAQLAGIAADIEASAVAIEAQLNQIIHEEVERLRILLRSTVNKHATSERDVLIDTLSRGRAPRVWTHEGVELRRALAHVFGQGFQQAAARLMSFHARVAPELRRLMDMLAPDARIADPHGETLAIPVPSIAPLSRLISLDLDRSWWSAFWSRQTSVETSGAKIEALIRAEFSPITEELLYVTEAAFQDFSTRTIKWSFGACRNLLHALERRPRQVQTEYADGRRLGDGAQVAQERAASLDFQRQRLQYNEALTQNLEHLTRYVDTVLQFEAPRP